MAALNDLKVKVGDVLNAYITAPITEKVWTVLGAKFGSDAGKSAIIIRALYGLKSAGAAFCVHLASFMQQWDRRPARLIPTYGIRLRPGLLTILGIMPTYCATLMTSSVCTMTQ